LPARYSLSVSCLATESFPAAHLSSDSWQVLFLAVLRSFSDCMVCGCVSPLPVFLGENLIRSGVFEGHEAAAPARPTAHVCTCLISTLRRYVAYSSCCCTRVEVVRGEEVLRTKPRNRQRDAWSSTSPMLLLLPFGQYRDVTSSKRTEMPTAIFESCQ
jgi:hypothetical protein